MSDRIAVPLPDGRWLAFDRAVFDAALAAGAEITTRAPSSAAQGAEPLLDAEQAAIQLNVTARWLEDSARAGIVPHHRLGRFIRFRVSEIANHSRVDGAPMPASTDSQSFTPLRRLARQ